jgi:hypothetical protein
MRTIISATFVLSSFAFAVAPNAYGIDYCSNQFEELAAQARGESSTPIRAKLPSEIKALKEKGYTEFKEGFLDLKKYRADKNILKLFKEKHNENKLISNLNNYVPANLEDFPSLKKEEIAAVYLYGDGKLNYNWVRALRSGEVKEIQKYEAEIKVLSSALNKLPPYKGTVSRKAALLAKDLKRYQPGDTIIESGFTSTTFDRYDPTELVTPMRGSNPKLNSVIFKIKSKTGKSIQELTRYNENEVLFPPGTKFKVVSRNTQILKVRPVHKDAEKFDWPYEVIELAEVE